MLCRVRCFVPPPRRSLAPYVGPVITCSCPDNVQYVLFGEIVRKWPKLRPPIMSGNMCEAEEWPPNGTFVQLTYGCYAKAALGYETNARYGRSDTVPCQQTESRCSLLPARVQARSALRDNTKRQFHCECDKLEQGLMLAVYALI